MESPKQIFWSIPASTMGLGLPLPNTFTGENDGYINLCINESVQLNASGADTYSWKHIIYNIIIKTNYLNSIKFNG